MNISKYLTGQTSIAPLAVFRVLFGFIMLVSIVRFALKGWIYDLYVRPDFYFSYYGFEWVQPLGETGMYLLFLIMGLAALGIMLGSFYRVSAVLFFLSFTYVELIDKTNYLNHYYFVSIVSFLLMLVPAHRRFSLDVIRKPDLEVETVPAWMITIFKLQLGIVYFYAGLAKLNPDWLLNAMPLKLWLPANNHLPVIGWLLDYEITAYFFSWAGALYDLSIVFFLLYKPTRVFAYMAVIVFHLLTLSLFQIGMFPYIMILSTLIFFSADFHEKIIQKARQLWEKMGFPLQPVAIGKQTSFQPGKKATGILTLILTVHFAIQVLVPFRFALYPGKLFWTEQGYRYSWRVMLMEKAGYSTFHVRNPQTDESWQVSGYEYLTPNQEKMMSTQPDMILQFAHFLEDEYQKKGLENIEIRAEAYVTLNGKRSSLFVDPTVDLTDQQQGFAHKKWILPYPKNEKTWLDSHK